MRARSLLLSALLAATLASARGAEGGERPPLTIYWSRACAPCQQLVSAWNADAEFRGWLKQEFEVQWIESNAYPLPRISVLGDELCGFAGKNRLAQHLQSLLDRHTSECPPFQQQQQSLPTQLLPALQQRLTAELDKREASLREEFKQRLTEIDQRLSSLNGHVSTHADRLNELVARANQRQASAEECHAHLAELRAHITEVRTELRALFDDHQSRFGAQQTDLSRIGERQAAFESRLSTLGSRFTTVENTLFSSVHTSPVNPAQTGALGAGGSPAVAADAAPVAPDHERSGSDARPPTGQSPVPTPSRTTETPGPAPVDLNPILARLQQLEQRINQPLTVELFDSGQPLGLIKTVDPHGGYLPLDIFGEERVLSEYPPTPMTEE